MWLMGDVDNKASSKSGHNFGKRYEQGYRYRTRKHVLGKRRDNDVKLELQVDFMQQQ